MAKLTYQQLAADKQELEDIIAMVAHKLGVPPLRFVALCKVLNIM
ncbi:MAG: hypothetical protein ABFS56_05755 [Pseudomonadota bacterium]